MVKIIVLLNGQQIISYIEDGYKLKKPAIYIMEDNSCGSISKYEKIEKKSFNVSLIPWIPLAKDVPIEISPDAIAAIVDPVEDLLNMYLEATK